MKIGVIAGSELALPLLAMLKNSGADVFLFADVDDRGSFAVVQHQCDNMHINVQQSEGDIDRLYPWADYMDLDIIFIIGYAHLVDINQLPKKLNGLIFNIHFGPLPAFKGPNPVFWQLKKGMPAIGITIHHVSMKFDSGKVVWYKEIPTQEYFTFGLVNQICSQVVLEGVIVILQQLTTRKPLPEPKTTGNPAYYKRPLMADVSVNWQQMNAREILNLVNACNPWNKGAALFYEQLEIKLLDATIIANKVCDDDCAPGTILDDKNGLHVSTCNKEVLNIHMLTINGNFVPARYAGIYGLKFGTKFN
jgi:methionyl-tRNA formyltransferase